MTINLRKLSLEEQFEYTSDELHVEPRHRRQIWSFLEEEKSYHVPTYEHSLRVGLDAARIAKEMLLDPKPAFYGLLHDIGKTRIPLEVLAKTEGFTKDDLEVMKAHVTEGYKILSEKGYTFSAWLALTHHRYQRNPYPLELPSFPEGMSQNSKMLSGIYSQIVSIADHNDALKRRNDKFGSIEMKQSKARQIMLANNPHIRYLITNLYKEGILT